MTNPKKLQQPAAEVNVPSDLGGRESGQEVKIERITPEAFEKAAQEKKSRGHVKKIIEQVKNDHQILKISGLRRGQVAALAKAAKAAGLKYLTFYDRGEIYLAPA